MVRMAVPMIRGCLVRGAGGVFAEYIMVIPIFICLRYYIPQEELTEHFRSDILISSNLSKTLGIKRRDQL